jgi:ribosomal protein S18 acetylase RimI-like enzyme
MTRSLIGLLAESGYARTSLSVDKTNYAAEMYAKLGFVVVDENDEDQLMVCVLTPEGRQTAS